MKTFDAFLETCKDELNHLQQNVKDTFAGWKLLFTEFRSDGRLSKDQLNSRINLSGLIKYRLSDEEAFFIVAFTGSYSSWINVGIRSGFGADTQCQQYFINGLIAAMQKLPSFNNSIVYRMDMPSGGSEQVINWFQNNNGKIVTTPYFLATSKEHWRNTEITWEIQTLKIASMGKDLQFVTNNTLEKEVLFIPNACFRIVGIDDKENLVKLAEVEFDHKAISLTGFYFEN